MSSEHSNMHKLPESQTWVQIPVLAATSCITLPKTLHFPESQSSQLVSGAVGWAVVMLE